MKIFSNIRDFKSDKKTVVTVGTFDGVHLGHQKILEIINDQACKYNYSSALLSFWPHPRNIIRSNNEIKMLTTLDEKIELLNEKGLDNLIIHPFDFELSKMEPLDYINDFLIKSLNAAIIVVGYDHRFGKDRSGGIETLKNVQDNFGFKLIEIPAQEIQKITAGSSKIREELNNGNIERANILLGYDFFINAKVEAGSKIGRQLGFPTANFNINSEKIIPMNGVYACRVKVKNTWFDSMMNIGKRPTIDNQEKIILEAHLFDFNDDIYNEDVKIKLIQRIRNEIKFSSLELLKEQLKKDKNQIINILRN